MDNAKLQQLVEEISLQSFQQPFLHQAVFNTRLRTTAGRYVHRGHIVEINPHYCRLHGPAELVDTIKHELCHYHLALEQQPFDHRSSEFRALLRRVGGCRYAKPSPELANKKHTVRIYTCVHCKHVYQRRRKVDTKRFLCGKCRGRLVEDR